MVVLLSPQCLEDRQKPPNRRDDAIIALRRFMLGNADALSDDIQHKVGSKNEQSFEHSLLALIRSFLRNLRFWFSRQRTHIHWWKCDRRCLYYL